MFIPAQKSKGFTLIELLVVVSILAILAVVSISVYANTQKGARDAKRRVEIDAIAKSIEVTRNVATQTYSYTATQAQSDFNPIPTDPVPADRMYCYAIGTTTTPPQPTTWGATLCPTAPGTWYVFNASNLGNASSDINNVPSWTVCAKLEVDNSFFCKSSLIR